MKNNWLLLIVQVTMNLLRVLLLVALLGMFGFALWTLPNCFFSSCSDSVFYTSIATIVVATLIAEAALAVGKLETHGGEVKVQLVQLVDLALFMTVVPTLLIVTQVIVVPLWLMWVVGAIAVVLAMSVTPVAKTHPEFFGESQ